MNAGKGREVLDQQDQFLAVDKQLSADIVDDFLDGPMLQCLREPEDGPQSRIQDFLKHLCGHRTVDTVRTRQKCQRVIYHDT